MLGSREPGAAALLTLLLLATPSCTCGGGSQTDATTGTDAFPGTDAMGGTDAANGTDATTGTDAAIGTDAGGTDAATGSDAAGSTDAGRLGPGECRGSSDCTAPALSCLQPGEQLPCGICLVPVNPCLADGDCVARGANFICEWRLSDCTCSGEMLCHSGCTAPSDCDPWEQCNAANNRCEPRACAVPADCPAQFDCGPGGCGRRPCLSDGQCDAGGFCVGGSCFDTPGSCSAIPP